MNLEGAVAIVTGAGGGIGRATVRRLLAAGAKVCAVDSSAAALRALPDQLPVFSANNLLCLQLDVTLTNDLEQMYGGTREHFGRLDIIHNNAGILGGPNDWPDIDIDTIHRVVDINLTSVLVSCRMAVDALRGSGGVIINTASKTVLYPGPMLAVYAASKAGVAFFTQSCAQLAETHGIRVNAVLPAATNTPLLRVGSEDTSFFEFLEGKVKPERLVNPDQVAAAVLGFCIDDTKFGECVVVDAE